MNASPLFDRSTREILLVEDCSSDVDLLQEALDDHSDLLPYLRVVEDGEAALAYLYRQPPYAEVNRPVLLLLDLNLPRIDGRGVLKTLKADPLLRTLPVVILTTAATDGDGLLSCEWQADYYITKPVGLEEYGAVVKLIEGLWRAAVQCAVLR